jgi:hypothetical protein
MRRTLLLWLPASFLWLSVSFGIAIPRTLNAPLRARGTPCDLLTRSEIQAVQGARITDTKESFRTDGGLSISQCFYTARPFDRSVSLELTTGHPSGGSSHAGRDRWNEVFHRSADTEESRAQGGKEEESRGNPPQTVAGVGEEAFWISNSASGALYALKETAYVRISIGGPDPEPTKRKKTIRLALRALRRL